MTKVALAVGGFVSILTAAWLTSPGCSACTAFLLEQEGEMVVGFNENRPLFPGFVMVNPREEQRSYCSWDELLQLGQRPGSRDPATATVKWTSVLGPLEPNR